MSHAQPRSITAIFLLGPHGRQNSRMTPHPCITLSSCSVGSSSEYSEMVTPVKMLSCMAKGRDSSQACLNQLSPKSRGFSVVEEEVRDLKHEKDLLV